MDALTFSISDYILWGMAILAVLFALWAIDAWGWIGSKIVKLLPQATLQKGDKAHIYLNGRYNRTATLSKVVADAVYIYDNKVKLPLEYRGRFYAIGTDRCDGSRLVYLPKRNYYRLVRVGEILRKVFALIEDETNLNPDYAEDEQLMTEQAQAEEGEADEM